MELNADIQMYECKPRCLWTNLQCVATHSLLQYSLSQSLLSTAGLVQPARTQILFEFSVEATLGTGATLTSTSIWDVEGDKQTMMCEPMKKLNTLASQHSLLTDLNRQKLLSPIKVTRNFIVPTVCFFTSYNIHLPVLFSLLDTSFHPIILHQAFVVRFNKISLRPSESTSQTGNGTYCS